MLSFLMNIVEATRILEDVLSIEEALLKQYADNSNRKEFKRMLENDIEALKIIISYIKSGSVIETKSKILLQLGEMIKRNEKYIDNANSRNINELDYFDCYSDKFHNNELIDRLNIEIAAFQFVSEMIEG